MRGQAAEPKREAVRAVTRAPSFGEVCAVPSKSDVHRALIAASLCRGETEIRFSHSSEDIRATLRSLAALGANIRECEGAVFASRGDISRSGAADAGESGSTLRFLLPVAAALGVPLSFVGSGRLPERPIGTLTALLREHGVAVSSDRLPLRIEGRLSGGEYRLPGDISSQYITGLLLALPLTKEASRIRLTTPMESASYVEMTLSVLSAFGIAWRRETDGFSLEKGASYRSPGLYTAEGDWSSAAFPLVSGALGGRVAVTGLCPDSMQADRAILDVLRMAGALVSVSEEGVYAEKGRLSSFSYDVSGCPDLFPVLAVLAAGAEGVSRLFGGRRLRLKESDRIASTCAMLSALGADITPTEDGALIRGGRRLRGGIVDGAGDHRIVMAAACARAITDGDILIRGADAVAKSYPTYFEDYAHLKGDSHEIELR